MSNILNYHQFDNQKNQGIALENILLLEDALRQMYIERLELFNKVNLEHNPEPFRFYKKEHCTILAFLLPFEFNELYLYRIYFLSTPNDRKENIITLTFDDLSDLDSYQDINLFFNDKILQFYEYNKSQIIFDAHETYPRGSLNNRFLVNQPFDAKLFIESKSLRLTVIRTIQNESLQFQKVNQTTLSYFAKDAYKFPFSIIDLKPLVKIVVDDDFSYQLDQAMAAYHQNLFLPCAATLGIALETLCIKILEDNGVKKIKSGDTQLGKLRERLINEKIITRRDNTRLEVAYKMRNMASHSSPGVALKEDCHFMLNVINTIALEYLNADQQN